MIAVINKYKETGYIWCGRGSALGNPSVMKDKSDSERNRVCDEYEQHFKKEVEVVKNEAMLKELRIIYVKAKNGNVNLGCVCSPKRCHCDTIKTFIDEHLLRLSKQ